MENTPGRRGGLNLKATELRLGLPGSESPERGNNQSPDPPPHHQLSIGLNNNNKSCFASSRAKRGFSVAIHDGSGNWVFSATAGSDSGKVVNGSGCGQTGKDSGLPQSPKKEATKEKKTTQVGAAAAANGHAVAPASK
ncbi:hypothetical protein Tsubulata_003199 [Turnera subulata]|uniref:Uncharacterized protein n=1 Tax=Turnera subulata TaxID=218843 RepID=A0A9Q0FYE1_9ROSI|nr:hypothetical protein Tsubulata_003199 [Turnera subulata]